jgi:hypothetical protein
LKKKFAEFGLNKELLKNKKQILNLLQDAKTQIESLMMTDVSTFRINLQKEIQEKQKKQKPGKEKETMQTESLRNEKSMSTFRSFNEKKSGGNETLDPKLSLKETLQKIFTNVSLRCSFEQLLKKNYNLSNWSFWLDINKLIEEERTIEEDFKRIQELTQKYLMETSIDEVKIIFFYYRPISYLPINLKF